MTFLFRLSDVCFDFKILSCLRPVVENLGNTYATALLAYTFSLAGDTSTRSQLLTALVNLVVCAKLHWSQTSSGDTLVVEICSYMLLAVLTEQPLSAANLGYVNRIVNWLVTQQNPYGGFSSTQDTVVALHALSVYAAKVFSLDGSSTVTVQSSVAGGESYSFTVNRDNSLLYQEKPLKNIPGKVTRSTCVSVQVPKGVPMTYTLQLKQVLAVKNLKPAVINVYDYYQTSDVLETTYRCPVHDLIPYWLQDT
ncbi:Alpha-1-inhibitor 3 [Anabarilius grahami]|uniref:Alpha-1-inhibitor 3 n=1 Tax=Anabarilius grahami TaxID=495550 RepID=A0A3N0XSC2_ANAGA|nr:Alpha-1-inhibitor 3 [Anabarilius grahami]